MHDVCRPRLSMSLGMKHAKLDALLLQTAKKNTAIHSDAGMLDFCLDVVEHCICTYLQRVILT